MHAENEPTMKTNTRGLKIGVKSYLRIAAKVILTVNRDIQNHLINGQTETIRHIEFAKVTVFKVYVKFSDEKSWLRSYEIILFRQTKLLGSYLKI